MYISTIFSHRLYYHGNIYISLLYTLGNVYIVLFSFLCLLAKYHTAKSAQPMAESFTRHFGTGRNFRDDDLAVNSQRDSNTRNVSINLYIFLFFVFQLKDETAGICVFYCCCCPFE